MEYADHEYTNTSDMHTPTEFSYKMTKKDIEDLVKLRVSNSYLFSGKKYTSMWAWRTILKHMGLHRKMTHTQASKKWENMKKRYKELKNPPEGAKVFPDAWPYYSLMDNAMAGRLVGSAPTLKAFPYSKDNGDFLIKPKRKKVPAMVRSSTVAAMPEFEISLNGNEVVRSSTVAAMPEFEISLNGNEVVRSSTVAAMPEIEISLNGNENGDRWGAQEGSQDIDCILQEVEDEERPMHGEQQVAEREKEVMGRERRVLQRERAVLDREIAILDRDRAVLERERAALEREKAVMERERSLVERARYAVSRDRLALEEEKARFERLCKTKEGSEEEITEDSSSGNEKDSDAVDRKQRLIFLFEKLIDNF